jgi:hypothetical protein
MTRIKHIVKHRPMYPIFFKLFFIYALKIQRRRINEITHYNNETRVWIRNHGGLGK